MCGEVYLMCRRNLIPVVGLIAFGLGVLVGGWIESGFLRCLITLGTIGGGILILGEKRRHK